MEAVAMVIVCGIFFVGFGLYADSGSKSREEERSHKNIQTINYNMVKKS